MTYNNNDEFILVERDTYVKKIRFAKKMTDSAQLIYSLILMKTMSAFFILHQFLGTVQPIGLGVQQTLGSGGAAQRCVFTRICSTIDERKSTSSYAALSISVHA